MAKILLAIINGALWAFLLAQNLYRYFHGWGRAWWIFAYGTIPVIGVALAIVIAWRSRHGVSRASFWMIVISTALAILYLAVAESPTSNDVQLVNTVTLHDR